jgi:integrase/recombinase XerD
MAIKKGVKIKLVLYHGIISLYLYDQVSKKSKRYMLGIESNESDFQKDCLKVASHMERAQDICKRIELGGIQFSFEMFERQFNTKMSEISIYGYGEEFMKSITVEKTRMAYSDSLIHIDKFSGANTTFGAITPSWIRKYQKYCHDNEMSVNTCNFHLRNLRALYNRAKEEGLAPQENPFKGFDLSSTPAYERYLSKEELEKFISHKYQDKDGKSRWKEAKDLFLFSYYSQGLNLKDILSLRHSKIKDNHFPILRTKTSSPLRIPINPPMRVIMDRYKTEEDLVFHHFMPEIKDKVVREKEHSKILGWVGGNIQRIAGQAEIVNHDDLVFYSARHTFAVHYLTIEKEPSVYELMRCLGHSSEKSTRNYMARLMGTENSKPIDFYDQILNNN